MFTYLKNSFARKIARRVTKEYPPIIDHLNMNQYGEIDFANWSSPLAPKITLNEATVAFFNQFIKAGDLAIDIGANIGDTTVPMALCTGMTGITIGFDPNPYVFKILETNANLNKDKYVIHPHRCAISSEPKSFYYISSEASFGNGAISETRDSKHGKFVYDGMVEGIHLKTFLETKYTSMIQKLSFIKIDTEGYDKEIIKSISDLIQAYKPVIVAESFGKASEAAKIELFEVIKNNGYDIFYFADFDINATVVELKVAADSVHYSQTINVYAVPKK